MKFRILTTLAVLALGLPATAQREVRSQQEFSQLPNGDYYFVSNLAGQPAVAMIVRKINQNAITFSFGPGIPNPSYCGRGTIQNSAIINVSTHDAIVNGQSWTISRTANNLRGPLHLSALLWTRFNPEQRSLRGFQSCLRFFGNR